MEQQYAMLWIEVGINGIESEDKFIPMRHKM